jgi:hypothetical protein
VPASGQSVTYRLPQRFNGAGFTDTFTYIVRDNVGGSARATVDVMISSGERFLQVMMRDGHAPSQSRDCTFDVGGTCRTEPDVRWFAVILASPVAGKATKQRRLPLALPWVRSAAAPLFAQQ